jgi:hypothetical protein
MSGAVRTRESIVARRPHVLPVAHMTISGIYQTWCRPITSSRSNRRRQAHRDIRGGRHEDLGSITNGSASGSVTNGGAASFMRTPGLTGTVRRG